MHTQPQSRTHTEIERRTPAGFKAADEIERARDEADLSRAVQAYCFFYPTVSAEGIMNGQREAGIADNHGMLLACEPRHVLFTGNSDTPYLGMTLDLGVLGPTVVEVPEGPFLGVVNDRHFRWIQDLGLPGPDAGAGGRHLLVPPGSDLKPPPAQYMARATTNKVLLALRALPRDGDMNSALEALRNVKIHPVAQAGSALPITDLTEHRIDMTCLRWETNIRFWEKLHKVLDEEPVFEEFRPMYGLLSTLGIEKGKPFKPDARMQSILERATKTAHSELLVAAFASRRADRLAFHDRRWEWVALGPDDGNFELPTGIDIDARNRWFSQAILASPAMFRRKPGAGSLYWLGLRDRRGEYLDGTKTYKLTVPQPVPSQLFWSVTVYDAGTRSQIQTAQGKAALRSLFELKAKADMPALDLYFGPRAPEGAEDRWIETLPGKGWFAYFRIYGPQTPAFDGTWRPGDFEVI